MKSSRPFTLHPPTVKEHVSVARLHRYWYVACTSKQLRRKPIGRTVLGIPMVLFRGPDGPSALLDRCPHRGVPMSTGRVVEGALQCPYHGWRFRGDGACVAVPGLCGEAEHRGRAVTRYPVLEQDGYVWVWTDPESKPDGKPFSFAVGPGYATVRAEMVFEGSVHAVAENALDVPHTAFLHGGLFRTSEKKNEITCQLTRTRDRVVTEYIGEPRPTGLIGRLLAPGGGVVKHWDRFLLPNITQVEYRIGETSHVLATQSLTPEEDFRTRMFAVLHFRIPWVPSWLVRMLVQPIAIRILRQDARVLVQQTDYIHRFGGEQYVSTELDLMGPQIWHLLKMAERGDLRDEPFHREVQMQV